MLAGEPAKIRARRRFGRIGAKLDDKAAFRRRLAGWNELDQPLACGCRELPVRPLAQVSLQGFGGSQSL